ncbi:hypothetical protein TKK_0010201 [Trichogramma kaykai]
MEPESKRLRSNPQGKNSIGKVRNKIFKGNQHTKAPETQQVLNAQLRSVTEAKIYSNSASRSKLQTPTINFEASSTQNRIVDFSLLLPFLEKNLLCKCGGKINFEESFVGGLGFCLSIKCDLCNNSPTTPSCKKVGPNKNVYENNRRIVLATRLLGLGLAGIQTLCGYSDLSKALEQKTYDSIVSTLKNASKNVAEESMKQAVEEEIHLSKGPELTVSGDGTWRTPGFTSQQGAAILIGHKTGKVLDVITKNTFCKACLVWQKKNSAEYIEWWEEHQEICTVNHVGSSGSMEVNGIVEMFQRSEDKFKVNDKNYIGDGDAKVYAKICAKKPYGEDYIVERRYKSCWQKNGYSTTQQQKTSGKNITHRS